MTYIAIILVLALCGWRGLVETIILGIGGGLVALAYVYFVIPVLTGGLHG